MSYIDEVVGDSPEGFWLLAEQSGSVAVAYLNGSGDDLTGAYVGGPTLGGASIIGTNYGVATTSSSNVSLPKPSDTPTAVTIEFWFQYVSGSGVIFRDSTSAAGTGWMIDLSGTNPVVVGNGASHTVTAITSASLKTGRHHVVLTADTAFLKLYTDKVLRDSWFNSAGGSSMVGPLVLGRDGTNATYTPTKFAAFAIYPYALGGAAIAAHYDAADAHLLGVAASTTAAAMSIRPNVTIAVGTASASTEAEALFPGFYTLVNLGTAEATATALPVTATQTFSAATGLVLTSSTTGDIVGPPDAPNPHAVPIRIVSPSTPTPTLVDGIPQ